MKKYNKGDVLLIELGIYRHYGIFDGDLVIHNSKKFLKVTESSLEEFSEGREIKVSEKIFSLDVDSAIQKARKLIGFPYGLFLDNCEQFVRVSCGMVRESPQVQKYLIGLTATATFVKSENKLVKAGSAGAALGTLLTPSEESPIGRSIGLSLLFVAGAAILDS